MSWADFSVRFTMTSLAGVVLVVYLMQRWARDRAQAPPRFEFGGITSVVALKAANGKYLEVSSEDGMLRATAESARTNVTAKFRVHVLSTATVSGLKLASAAAAPWDEANGGTTTASGCKCTGFSNEHGFGRYCHPWESDMQVPWCYVSSDCAASQLGSFGRRHAQCSLLAQGQTAAGGPTAAVNTTEPSPYSSDDGMRWVPPPQCPCSGVRSSLGYGAFCRAWEVEGQTPWCYTFDNCSLSTASAGRRGSFGHKYVDCILEADPAYMAPGRRLQRGEPHRRRLRELQQRHWRASPPEQAAASHRDPDEDALLERVEHLRQPHVALVSLATEGFVSVELPPHRLALRAHARTDALSMKGVFSFLRSGAIMSLATNALLSLCPAPTVGDSPVESVRQTMEACTTFPDPASSIHPKLLRSPKDARGMATFTVERLEQQGMPKPKASPIIKGVGGRLKSAARGSAGASKPTRRRDA